MCLCSNGSGVTARRLALEVRAWGGRTWGLRDPLDRRCVVTFIKAQPEVVIVKGFEENVTTVCHRSARWFRRAQSLAKAAIHRRTTWVACTAGMLSLGHLGLNTVAVHVGLYVRFRLAVDLFFVLSGYVLTLNYHFHQRTFLSLLVGRVARLYPLHALTLLMTVCVFRATSKPVDWNAVWQHAFLVHNIGDMAGLSGRRACA